MTRTPVYTVTQVNQYIKTLLDRDRALAGLCVRGELSNYKVYPSGHHYFSLKDEAGAIRCVMFRREAAGLRFRPENGWVQEKSWCWRNRIGWGKNWPPPEMAGAI